MRTGKLIGLTLALALCAAPAASIAGDNDTADVRIRVIHATQGKKFEDPKLKDLTRYLKIYQYSSYKQVIDQTLTLKQGQTKGIGLLRGKNLNAELVTLEKEKATLQLKLFGPTGVMLNTKVNVGSGGLFFIAGPRYQKGVLFISVSARYDIREEGARVSGTKTD